MITFFLALVAPMLYGFFAGAFDQVQPTRSSTEDLFPQASKVDLLSGFALPILAGIIGIVGLLILMHHFSHPLPTKKRQQ
jgi:hypothetical protein